MFDSPSQAEKFVRPEDIVKVIDNFHPNLKISEGKFSSTVPGYVNDVEWNHQDQAHRVFVHDAYHEAMRLVTGKDFAFSVTRINKWPIFLPVFDVRLGPGLFYQILNVFGLLHCHQFTQLSQLDEQVQIDIVWYTASHRWLWFLHGPFNKRLARLQKKQDSEDLVIRQRRYELRKRRFNFKTNRPDFISANVLSDCIIFPDANETHDFDLKNLPLNQRTKVSVGSIELYIEKTSEGIKIWPAICPHEGAEIPDSKFSGQTVQCPWHGRKFSPVWMRDSKAAEYPIGNKVVAVEGDKLIFKARAAEIKSTIAPRVTN